MRDVIPEMKSYLDEIQNDVWHTLLHLFSYQEKSSKLASSGSTRFELIDEVIALNSLAENIVLRIARLADSRRDVRSIKNYCKSESLSSDVQTLAADFQKEAQTVVRLRHERIAHMKAGDLSMYPLQPLPVPALKAIEALVRLVDSLAKTVDRKSVV